MKGKPQSPPPPDYYADPVMSGHFSYHPSTGLQVEVAGQPRSAASSDYLYKVLRRTSLTPIKMKQRAGVMIPGPHERAPFFEAQLIHFGLESVEGEEAAVTLKRALIDAKWDELKVPKEIKEMEKELRRQYRIADAAAKKEWKEEQKEAKARRAMEEAAAEEKAKEPISKTSYQSDQGRG